MAGGNFTTQNKLRPGAYINVKGTQKPVSSADTVTGVVALPIPLDFGPEKQVVEVQAETDLTPFGYELSAPEMLLLREALKQARTVLVYRVGTGVKASITQEAVTVTAKYAGARGNAINVSAVATADDATTFEVTTYLEGRNVDSQTASTVEELQANSLVEFSGTGALSALSGALEGGTSEEASADDYADFFAEIQLHEFNTIALPVEDDSVKTAGISFTERMRTEEGNNIQLVVAGTQADSKAVISVLNGVILEDGEVISAAQATAWQAAASASAGMDRSLTYTAYNGAVGVTQRYLDSEIKDALRNGHIVFVEKRGRVVVEQDINTLVTFSSGETEDFKKNLVVRVLDTISNNSKQTWEDNFIGQFKNGTELRELFKANRVEYLNALQGADIIEGFTPDDVEVVAGQAKDSIYMRLYVKPLDAAEKLYADVLVS